MFKNCQYWKHLCWFIFLSVLSFSWLLIFYSSLSCNLFQKTFVQEDKFDISEFKGNLFLSVCLHLLLAVADTMKVEITCCWQAITFETWYKKCRILNHSRCVTEPCVCWYFFIYKLPWIHLLCRKKKMLLEVRFT